MPVRQVWLADVIVHLEDCCGSHVPHVDLSCISVCLMLIISTKKKREKMYFDLRDYSTSLKQGWSFIWMRINIFPSLCFSYLPILSFPCNSQQLTLYRTYQCSPVSSVWRANRISTIRPSSVRTGVFFCKEPQGLIFFWPCRPPRLLILQSLVCLQPFKNAQMVLCLLSEAAQASQCPCSSWISACTQVTWKACWHTHC